MGVALVIQSFHSNKTVTKTVIFLYSFTFILEKMSLSKANPESAEMGYFVLSWWSTGNWKTRRIVSSRKRTSMLPDFDKHKHLHQSWKLFGLTLQHDWGLSSRICKTIKGSVRNLKVSLKPVFSYSTRKQGCFTMVSSCFSRELCHAHKWFKRKRRMRLFPKWHR